MARARDSGYAWVLSAWLVLTILTLATRPLLPLDETRYAAVAWEMWLHGDWLVPHLNGQPYAHKPPLLFWLIKISWSLFGVNDWSMRLIPPLFGLGSLLLTSRIAGCLWPEDHRTAMLSTAVLFSMQLWLIYAPALMFDLVLTFFVLFGLLGMCRVWRRQSPLNWAIVGLAIAGGILAKGPVALLYLLPPALFAPLYLTVPDRARFRRQWYTGCLVAVAAGSCLPLAWALPAAGSGGAEYREAILWTQTAGRAVAAFDHARTWWWYLAALPLALFPWSLWPRGWRLLYRSRWDDGSIFCAIWCLSGLVLLSIVSGKQPHYLLPLLPGFALLMTRAWKDDQSLDRSPLLPAVLVMLTGVVLAVVVLGFETGDHPDWVGDVSPRLAGGLIVFGTVILFLKVPTLDRQVAVLAGMSTTVTLVLTLGVMHPAWPSYDTTPIASRLAKLQRNDIPLAFVGNYHGQFQYTGRLREPLTVLGSERLDFWAMNNPDGRLILNLESPASEIDIDPDYSQPFRGRYLMIVPAREFLETPSISRHERAIRKS